jgi:ABC-2 type transport system permease protein
MKRNLFEITKTVTIWEFNRFFKWMDLIKGALFFAGFAIVGGVVGAWAGSQAVEAPTVAVSSYGPFNSEDFDDSFIRYRDMSALTADSLEILYLAEEIDAILSIIDANEATLRVNSDRAWILQLEQQLNTLRVDLKLERFGLDAEVYEELTAGVTLNRVFESGEVSSIADKVLAGVAISLLLMAVFMGFAYQFTAITAEKQQRITEQVLSAISPQTWIDGKILGITGVGLAYVAFYGVFSVLGIIVLVYFGMPLQQTLALINPVFVVTFLMLALVGTLMWNAFLAGVAATIDDPNTSAKSGLMVAPMFPVMLAFFTLANPDTLAMKVLGLFPLTSYAVLPARMVLTNVAWWEPVVALVLVAATAWLLRIVAGRIFAAGMMMYGKEPNWREMLRWMVKGTDAKM